jgi:hypothetical protein
MPEKTRRSEPLARGRSPCYTVNTAVAMTCSSRLGWKPTLIASNPRTIFGRNDLLFPFGMETFSRSFSYTWIIFVAMKRKTFYGKTRREVQEQLQEAVHE